MLTLAIVTGAFCLWAASVGYVAVAVKLGKPGRSVRVAPTYPHECPHCGWYNRTSSTMKCPRCSGGPKWDWPLTITWNFLVLTPLRTFTAPHRKLLSTLHMED